MSQKNIKINNIKKLGSLSKKTAFIYEFCCIEYFYIILYNKLIISLKEDFYEKGNYF